MQNTGRAGGRSIGENDMLFFFLYIINFFYRPTACPPNMRAGQAGGWWVKNIYICTLYKAFYPEPSDSLYILLRCVHIK